MKKLLILFALYLTCGDTSTRYERPVFVFEGNTICGEITFSIQGPGGTYIIDGQDFKQISRTIRKQPGESHSGVN